MPDSPGRELQVDVTCACNARFLATLDPHFISIETPSDRGKISARGSGRFCTARELMQDLSHPSPATARRSGLRTNPNASATSSAAETTRAMPRTACSSVCCALAAKRPASKAWRGAPIGSAACSAVRCLSTACLQLAFSAPWARDSGPARGRATRASTSVWVGGCCQRVWLPGRLLAAGLAAGCWLRPSRCLAVITTLATWYRNSVLLSATWLPFRPVFHCLAACRGRNAWGSAAARRGSCFAPSSEQTGSRTRGRSSSHTYCSCHPQPVVYPHPSQLLFSHIEAV